jgi:hypothetical protein
MNDLRDRLDLVSQGVSPRSDSFERLGWLRDRRRLFRRVGAGVMGVAVAAVGTGLAVVALGGGTVAPRPPGATTPGLHGSVGHRGSFHALWPEVTREDAVREQRAVDRGADAWRLRSAAVARRFAGTGGGDAPFNVSRQGDQGPGYASYSVNFISHGPGPGPSLHLVLQQSVRRGTGGIWSITKVEDESALLDVAPGSTVAFAGRVGLAALPYRDVVTMVGATVDVDCGAPWTTGVAVRVTGRRYPFVRSPVALAATLDLTAAAPKERCGGTRAQDAPAPGILFVKQLPQGEGLGSPLDMAEFQASTANAAVAVEFVPNGSGPGPGIKSFDSPAGWTVTLPSSWSADVFSRSVAGGESFVRGSVVSSFVVPGDDLTFPDGFPDDGVAAAIEQSSGGFFVAPVQPDSGLPVSFAGFESVAPGMRAVSSVPEFRDHIVANGSGFRIEAWVGVDASAADRAALEAAVASLRFRALAAGDVVGFPVTLDVLGRLSDYPVGSVTRFGPKDLRGFFGIDSQTTFFLVRRETGTWAVVTSGSEDIPLGCGVSYDAAARVFRCGDLASWDLRGRVISPAGSGRGLNIALVRTSLDGHVLVCPSVQMDSTRTDRKLTSGSG